MICDCSKTCRVCGAHILDHDYIIDTHPFFPSGCTCGVDQQKVVEFKDLECGQRFAFLKQPRETYLKIWSLGSFVGYVNLETGEGFLTYPLDEHPCLFEKVLVQKGEDDE